MRAARGILAWLLVGSAFGACGGKIAEEDQDEEKGGRAESERPAPPSKQPMPPGPWGPTQLPKCEPGFEPGSEPDRSCNWMAKGLCYSEKLAACACVCPSREGTTCFSDFPEEDGRVEVRCN